MSSQVPFFCYCLSLHKSGNYIIREILKKLDGNSVEFYAYFIKFHLAKKERNSGNESNRQRERERDGEGEVCAIKISFLTYFARVPFFKSSIF